MDPTLTALREHMLTAAPTQLYLCDEIIHCRSTCPSATGCVPASTSTVVDLAITGAARACAACPDNVWARRITRTGTTLPALLFGRADRSLSSARHLLTPRWLQDGLAPTSGCCQPADPADPAWLTTLQSLHARHSHRFLTERAARFATPSTWVALARRQHLQMPAGQALAAAAYFHPWASARPARSSIGVTLMHLPAGLARAAVDRGAVTLDAGLIDPLTWQVTTRLLADEHAGQSPDTLWAERELDLVAATPALLAVGHAATH